MGTDKEKEFWKGLKENAQDLRRHLLKTLGIELSPTIEEIRRKIVIGEPVSIFDLQLLVKEGDKEDLFIIKDINPEDTLEHRKLTELRQGLEEFVNEELKKEIEERLRK